MCKDCGCNPGYCACGPSVSPNRFDVGKGDSVLARAIRMRQAREAREATKDDVIRTLKCENKELREENKKLKEGYIELSEKYSVFASDNDLSAQVKELLANQDELRHNAQSDAAHIDALQKDNQTLREDIVRRAIELASLKQTLWDTCELHEAAIKERDDYLATIYRMHNIIAQHRAERKHLG